MIGGPLMAQNPFDSLNDLPLTPIQKEQRFAEELQKLVNHFCDEHEMTYGQVIGTMSTIMAGFISENLGKKDTENEDVDE